MLVVKKHYYLIVCTFIVHALYVQVTNFIMNVVLLKTQTQTNIWNANIIQLFIISPNVANQIARVNDSEFDI